MCERFKVLWKSHLSGVKEPMVACTFRGKLYDSLSQSMVFCICNSIGCLVGMQKLLKILRTLTCCIGINM